MANKTLFSQPGRHVPMADTTNAAGGKAYKLTAHQALAQYAHTGTFNDTFYVDAKGQLGALIDILKDCDPTFIAKAAVHARQVGFMKDMPVFLTAYLFVLAKGKTPMGERLPENTFDQVIRNGKLLRTFMQFLRSGALSKPDGKPNKAPGTRAKKAVQRWLNQASDKLIINASVGNEPSLKDVLSMVHPKPVSKEREALFAWVMGKEGKEAYYPPLLKQLLDFRAGRNDEAPDVDFRLIVDSQVSKSTWSKIAKNAPWHMARMNLNTFQRQGVLDDDSIVDKLAAQLKDPEQISKSMVFPYQLLAAWKNTTELPAKLRNSLQDALDVSLNNVPKLDAKVVVCPDVSGSMASPVTGNRGSATTKVRCIDVAGLVASALMRKNDETLVLPFDTSVHSTSSLNPRDSVVTNADKLARFGGGGTNCGLPLEHLNKNSIKADLVIYVSDNESWLDRGWGGGTKMMEEWKKFKKANPKAKLVLIDVTPAANSQVVEDKDILRIGGFSDEVFKVLPDFLSGKYGSDAWVEEIDKIDLRPTGKNVAGEA